MSLLTRYILRRFWSIAVFTLMASVAIFITVDLMENLDKFIDTETGWQTIVRYYLLYIPQIAYLITPVVMLLTTVFSLGSLVRTSEVTAMKAGGISPGRILRLLALQGLLVSVGVFYLGETLVTDTAGERNEIYQTCIKKRPPTLRQNSGHVYFQNDSSSMFSLDNFNLEQNEGRRAVFLQFDGSTVSHRLDAERISLRDSVWTMYDVDERWLAPRNRLLHHEVLAVPELQLNPYDIQSLRSVPEEMNYSELGGLIARLRQAGARITRWQVDAQIKLASPFANLMIILLGVPLALRRNRGGLVKGLGLSLLLCFLYYGMQVVLRNMGYKELLGPEAAAWLPNLTVLIVALFSFYKLDK